VQSELGPQGQSRIFSQYTQQHPHIAAVLPAYNEAGRIGNLLAVLRDVPSIREIIVVDDGSQDDTAQEAFQAATLDPRIRVVRHERNLGKGAAVFNGSHQTTAPILLFLDSDLFGLAPSQVEDLIRPVVGGQADMSIGVFRHGNFVTDLSHRLTPWLSGQRCLKSYLLGQVSARASAGYGVETAITIAARQGKWRVETVPLVGVSHPTGEIHRGLIHGITNRLRMYLHILKAAWLASVHQVRSVGLENRVYRHYDDTDLRRSSGP
jgi:glycosyltransferase involved in cell wall biosynthesis